MTTISVGTTSTTAYVATPDTTGTLVLKTGAGNTTALTLDASQNATFAGTLSSGDFNSSGVITGSTGALYPLTRGVAVAAASQTAITYTTIPSTANRVTIGFTNFSSSGTSQWLIQLGTSAGITNTGYASVSTRISGAAASQFSSTAGVLLATQVAAASVSGVIIFNHIGSNVWVATGTAGDVTAAIVGLTTSGSKTLPGILDRLSITTVNGTDTFDAGAVNILWE